MIIIHAVKTAPILPRLLSGPISTALRTDPVVVVTGARQTGKSTLARSLLAGPERSYLTLDDLDVRADAESSPDDLVRRAARLTLDEVQRSPSLLLAVKRAVDERRMPGRFLLTGSANLLLLRRVSETLAGRASYFTLWPLTRGERLGLGRAGLWQELFDTADHKWPDLLRAQHVEASDWRAHARAGGYPVPAHQLEDAATRNRWFAGFATTYLERDLQDLSAVQSVIDFRRLMRAACLRLGNLVNQTELGRDVGLSQPTVHRYLNLLEVSYQLVRLPAYSVNRTKRLIKTPKLYWSDTALAMHLAGETSPRGVHLENLVLSDLLAWRGASVEAPEILYWRTATGEEVDFVIEWRGELLPIEIKTKARPSTADARHLKSFREQYPDLVRWGLVLHTGEEVARLADGVVAAPWWMVI